jgi:23S rRNA pseudouridine2605 synthase
MKIRLQRFLADCGVASRRECEAMIAGGRVRVNGEVQTKMPVMIEPEKDAITVDEEEVGFERAGKGAPSAGLSDGPLKEQNKVYFLLNKPKGILVTNYDPSERKTVGELMKGVKERVFPVGRLEMDSRGALIMTNDGELANRLTHPRYGVEKVYIVEVDGRIGHDDLEKIKRGIWLGPDRPRGETEGKPRPAVKAERFKIKVVGRERGRTVLELNVAEGKNREIRRVMARIGHVVRDLNRVSIAEKLTTKGLDPGEFRPLTDKEVKWLYHASSKEYHGEQRAETQAWYEAKEMEKERKRLEKEAAAAKLRPPAPKSALSAEEKRFKKFQERPERKGKKPFVPPTGRNAGKSLGGNFIGKQRLEREASKPIHEDGDALEGSDIPQSPKRAHPLGDAAQSDE